MTMQATIDLDALAMKIGELCGAARHDWSTANYEDVGLNGMPIKGWREAYFEGCTDMANMVLAAMPVEDQDAFKAAAKAAFSKSFDAAKAASDGEASK